MTDNTYTSFSNIFGYYINLDERGDFFADVRKSNDESVFEIHAGTSLDESESSLFDDGFMRNKHDLDGLTKHLKDLGILSASGIILNSHDFEDLMESEPEAIRTEDGYCFIRLEDGSYVDNLNESMRDTVFESIEDIEVDWKPMLQNEIAERFLNEMEEIQSPSV